MRILWPASNLHNQSTFNQRSDGALRYRASGIDEFLKERERAAHLQRKRR